MQKEFETEYKIQAKRAKVLKKRKYRGIDPGVKNPSEHELNPRSDFEVYKKMKERKAKEAEKPKEPAKEPVKEPVNKPKEILTRKVEVEEKKAQEEPVKPKPQIVEIVSKDVPKYEVHKLAYFSSKSFSSEGMIKIEMELPKVSQMSEIDLFVSDKCVKVSAKEYEDTSINLDETIEKSAVRAGFNKKKKVLTIKLSIIKIK